eukprot:gene9508-1714_t
MSEEKQDEGYVVPKKVDMDELAKMDSEDESLARYKQQLLGKALEKQEFDDDRRVIIVSFGLNFPNKEREDLLFPLDTPEKLAALKANPIVVKEGTDYVFECKFKVYHDIISALKFVNTVSRGGIKLEKKSHMMGSYGPNAKDINSWKSPTFTAPAGMLARGTYKGLTQFIDDDGAKHLEFDYSLTIAKEWKE